MEGEKHIDGEDAMEFIQFWGNNISDSMGKLTKLKVKEDIKPDFGYGIFIVFAK